MYCIAEKAKQKDLAIILKIFEDNHKSGSFSNTDYKPSIYNLDKLWTFSFNGQMVGYAIVQNGLPANRIPTELYIELEDSEILFICQIAIDTESKRRGYGTLFYNLLAQNNPVIYAYVALSSKQSMNFHRAYGFKIVGVFEPPKAPGEVLDDRFYLMRYELETSIGHSFTASDLCVV